MFTSEGLSSVDPSLTPATSDGAHRSSRTWLIVGGVALLIGIAIATGPFFWGGGLAGDAEAHAKGSHAAAGHGADANSTAQKVETVLPAAGGLERTVEVPGSVRAFDYADLYARVAGFLQLQNVDIGDRVKKGQLLAELDVPELLEEVGRRRAELSLSRAQVQQSEAAVKSAVAETEVANAMVQQADAEVGRATAARMFREKQYIRMKDLRGMKAIDERLVDEKQDEFESASSAEEAARAKVLTARSQVAAASAKVEQAQADLDAAKSRVSVCQAELKKSEVQVQFSKIVSPYDGVITARNFHIGDYIASADQQGGKPVLQVQKNEIMRLITQVPDRDVAFVDVGDLAEFRVDGLNGSVIQGTVSRFSNSEDERTRSMRTEVDLKNPDGKLRDGMYGQVLFHLQKASPDAVHVPSACLIGSSRRGATKVFVVQDGKLRLIPVRVGYDNGVVVEVLEGLTVESQVVFAPAGDLVDGSAVEPHLKSKSAP